MVKRLNSHKIVKFIYELFNDGILLWSDFGRLKAFVPEGQYLSEDSNRYIRENKDSILEILEKSKVFDKKNVILTGNSTYNELSFSQEQLWFIEQYERGSNAYNISMVYELSDAIDVSILELAIENTVLRHEILYTLLSTDENGKGCQVVQNKDVIPSVFKQLSISNDIEWNLFIESETNYIFKLDSELPIRISIISREETKNNNKTYIVIIIHHIAFDGWSQDILLRDIKAYYRFCQESALGGTPALSLPE